MLVGQSGEPHDPPGAAEIATLAGDPARLAVERCIAELRAARPVLLVDEKGERWALAAAETAGSDLLSFFRRTPGGALVLGPTRLRHLGRLTDLPLGFGISGWSDRQVADACIAEQAALPSGIVSVGAAGAPAIELLKRAQLAPAALVAPVASGDADGLMTVDAAAIAEYHDRVAETLAIAARARVPLLDSQTTDFVVFHGGDGLKDQVAIVIGDPDPSRPVPVRLHSACLTGDLFGSLKCDCGEQLRLAVRNIADLGGGVLLYLDQEGRGIGLRSKIRTYRLQEDGHDTVESDAILGFGPDERRYAIAARMLTLLGYGEIDMLTNNPDKIGAMEKAGLVVSGNQRLLGTVNNHNRKYLATKAAKAGHRLEALPLTGTF
jgi:GTP cyclohydrolase II